MHPYRNFTSESPSGVLQQVKIIYVLNEGNPRESVSVRFVFIRLPVVCSNGLIV
jgi:hypothetical protein